MKWSYRGQLTVCLLVLWTSLLTDMVLTVTDKNSILESAILYSLKNATVKVWQIRSCQSFSFWDVNHFSFTLTNRLTTKTNTDTAHRQTLESVGADPHLSVCGPIEAQQDWRGASRGAERKVKQLEGENCHIWYSQEAVDLYVLSHWKEPRRAVTQAYTCAHFYTFTSEHTCVQTCSHTHWWQVKGDREWQLNPGGNQKEGEMEGSWESGAEEEETLRKLLSFFTSWCKRISSHGRYLRLTLAWFASCLETSFLLKPEEVTVKLVTTERWRSSEK